MSHKIARGYITSIDGMRAIAVMAVLLFHVDFEWAAGGFTGVDVFFVISGFLITRNIIHEVKSGTWSFGKFYLRRATRLFPALFATIVFTLIAAWWILSPADLERVGQTSMMSVLSVGNIFFWLESGYFDANSATKPLLHTWSLAVEEQFYLVWPGVLLLLLLGGRLTALWGVIFLGLISLIAAFWFLTIDPSAVFFLMPFRIHQFAVGAIIAIVGWLPSKNASSVASAAAFLGIIAVTAFVSNSSHYFFSAILPACFAGILLLTSRSRFANSVLSMSIAVWVGRRSYSIYLAHWPIIVLWKLNSDLQFSLFEQIAALTVSVLAGAVLFELVENLFRFKPKQSYVRKRLSVLSTVVLGSTAITIGASYWGSNGYVDRVPIELQQAVGNGEEVWADRQQAVRDGICSHTTTSAQASNYNRELCSSPPKSGRSYLVVGDSFANDAMLVLKSAYPDLYFGQLTVPGCLLRLPKQFEPGEQTECRRLYEIAFEELLQNSNYDGVVLSSNWQDGHYYRINDLINSLQSKELDIILIGQRVRFRDRVPAIVASSESVKAAVAKANSLLRPDEFAINSTIVDRFSARVKVIDFIALSCPDTCDIITREGDLIYMDDSHFSLSGVDLIASRLKFRRPEL